MADKEAEAAPGQALDESWLEKSCAELEKACSLTPPIPHLDDDASAPAWVERLNSEVTKAFFPGAYRGQGKGLTPGRLGYALGRQMALLNWFGSFLVRLAERLEGVITLTPEQTAQGEEWVRRMAEDFAPAYSRAVNRTLLRAVNADFDESAKFFQQFGEGLTSARGTGDSFPGSGNTTATDLYQVMLWCWPSIVRLQSVRQLHGLLSKILGAGRVGPQKRVEKLCQRIGLSLRPRGRPSSRNTDKATP